MVDFAIIDPKHGIAENMPTVILPEAFMAKGSENVHFLHGRYDKLNGRVIILYDSENVEVQAPTDVYAISSINTSLKRITITGDHSAGATALAEGDTIRVNGGTTAANNITFTVSSLPTTSQIVVPETISSTGAAKGSVFVGATPVIRYHRHVKHNTSVEYLLLGTKSL